MISRDLRLRERGSEFQAGLRSVWNSLYESRGVSAVRKATRFVRSRWLAFSFTRRFYSQVCRADATVSKTESNGNYQDFTECLFQRSLPQKLHTIVQLRVASQVASLAETAARTEACHSRGWSEDQIRAAMIRNLEGTFSVPEVLALRYADELTRTPIDVDPQTIKELRKYFSQSEVTELTASIAYENFRCRFTDANSRIR